MNDKQWLDKVEMCAKVYKEMHSDKDNSKIEEFVSWMYRQFGIVQPSK